MAPLKPHWKQPSHPDVQEVLIAADETSFTTKSLSRVSLPPFAFFAALSSPPLTPAAKPTYATVQVGKDQHINLNSDLLYINHSCEPSLIFDTSARVVWVGPKGLKPGDELTFFYPSTEWDMAQPFNCFCGAPTCRGLISGAGAMSREKLAGLFLNGHIWALLRERDAAANGTSSSSEVEDKDQVPKELLEVLAKAEETLGKADEAADAARRAVATYRNKVSAAPPNGAANGAAHRGPSSRELGGEMGGDTRT